MQALAYPDKELQHITEPNNQNHREWLMEIHRENQSHEELYPTECR
jgi:hypothetical protein